MLKRDITYEDADEEKVTETFYFNITQSEFIELQVSYPGGMVETLQSMVKSKDENGLVQLVKKLILMSYGVRSDDGKHFFKNDDLRDKFAQSFAYNSLFMELASSDTAALTFIMGIFPKDFTKNVDQAELLAAVTVPTKE